MLTKENNALLTEVGRGTPAGTLLRCYWHPVAFMEELTEETPTVFVRILGEDLVLFRDKSGNVGASAVGRGWTGAGGTSCVTTRRSGNC